MKFSVTLKAIEFVLNLKKKIIEENKLSEDTGLYLRVGAKPSSCACCTSYELSFTDKKTEDDEVFEFGQLIVVIDKKFEKDLDNTEMDVAFVGLEKKLKIQKGSGHSSCCQS